MTGNLEFREKDQELKLLKTGTESSGFWQGIFITDFT